MGLLNHIQNLLFPTSSTKQSPLSRAPKQLHRAFRVDAHTLQRLIVHNLVDEKVEPLAVLDISTTGVGFLQSSFINAPEVGSVIRCRFLLDEKEIFSDLIIRRVHNNTVGCQFSSSESEIRKALFSTYHPEIIAASMYKVQAATETASNAHWFTGENNSELYFEGSAENGIQKFTMRFLGNYFRYPAIDSTTEQKQSYVQYGTTDSLGEIAWQDVPSKTIADFAKRVIQNLNELSNAEAELLLNLFN